MPTQAVRPQQDGFYREATNIVGGTFAWEVVDDSFDATHDSDVTTLTIGRSKRASFPAFLMFSTTDVLALSVLVRTVAKKTGAPAVALQLGLSQGGAVQIGGADIDLTLSYIAYTRTFATNPFTGAAWAVGDLVNMELHLQRTAPFGNTIVTLLNGELIYELPNNPRSTADKMGAITA